VTTARLTCDELDRRHRAARQRAGRRSQAACPWHEERPVASSILAAEDVARAPDPPGLCHARTGVTERDHQRLLEPIAAGRSPHDPRG
jgi:hypothetical protein